MNRPNRDMEKGRFVNHPYKMWFAFPDFIYTKMHNFPFALLLSFVKQSIMTEEQSQ